MSFLDSIARQASRVATDVQHSLRRARLEGERRVLQRQHRTALEELGERTHELVREGRLPDADLGPELAAVESKLMEIEAKATEIGSVRAEEEAAGDAGSTPGGEGGGTAEDPADVAFPMLKDTPDAGDAPPRRTGWEAADRFFRSP